MTTKPLDEKIVEAFLAALDASTLAQPYRRDNLVTTLRQALRASLVETIVWPATDREVGYSSIDHAFDEGALETNQVQVVDRAVHLPRVYVFRGYDFVDGDVQPIQVFSTELEAVEADINWANAQEKFEGDGG